MCGIVGVIGKKDTTEILLNGLQKLEYRGYDSAGIYVNDQAGHDYLVKEKGKIAELDKAVGPEVQAQWVLAIHVGQPMVNQAMIMPIPKYLPVVVSTSCITELSTTIKILKPNI